MKVHLLVECGYEDLDVLGVYSSRELAEIATHDFEAKRLNKCRIIEWEMDKLCGNFFESWDNEAFIKPKERQS
jgi:hypothetical protein